MKKRRLSNNHNFGDNMNGVIQQPTFRKLDAIGVYEISTQIEYLRTTPINEIVLHQDNSVRKNNVGYIIDSLNRLILQLNIYNLMNNHKVEMYGIQADFTNRYSKAFSKNISEQDRDTLIKLATKLGESFGQYIAEKNFVDIRINSGIIDYEKLFKNGIVEFFGERDILVFLGKESIGSNILEDINESISCGAYGLSTPSVIMALRGVEGMLRYSYKTLLKKDSGNMTWEPLLKAVKTEFERLGIKIDILEGYLVYLKDKRDDAAHPGKRFDPRDAENTLINSRQAIIELKKLLTNPAINSSAN